MPQLRHLEEEALLAGVDKAMARYGNFHSNVLQDSLESGLVGVGEDGLPFFLP